LRQRLLAFQCAAAANCAIVCTLRPWKDMSFGGKYCILYFELVSLRLWGNKLVSHTLSAPPPPLSLAARALSLCVLSLYFSNITYKT